MPRKETAQLPRRTEIGNATVVGFCKLKQKAGCILGSCYRDRSVKLVVLVRPIDSIETSQLL